MTLVLGGSGFVGSRLIELWRETMPISAPTHAQLDLLDNAALVDLLSESDDDVVINLAAWADVDGAESQAGDTAGTVFRLNTELPGRLAQLCGDFGKHLVHVSTDYVFDGTSAERPYREEDATRALCWYGQTKLGGEQRALASGAPACVARIEMPFSAGEFPRKDVARTFAARLRAGQPIQGVVDQHITPVFLDDAVRALNLVAENRYTGVVHVAPTTWTTPYELARGIAQRLELDLDLVQPTSFEEFARMRPARRPQHSWLDVSKFTGLFGPEVLHSVEEQLDRWAAYALASGRT